MHAPTLSAMHARSPPRQHGLLLCRPQESASEAWPCSVSIAANFGTTPPTTTGRYQQPMSGCDCSASISARQSSGQTADPADTSCNVDAIEGPAAMLAWSCLLSPQCQSWLVPALFRPSAWQTLCGTCPVQDADFSCCCPNTDAKISCASVTIRCARSRVGLHIYQLSFAALHTREKHF